MGSTAVGGRAGNPRYISRELKFKKQRKERKANTHQAGGCTEPTQPSRNRESVLGQQTDGRGSTLLKAREGPVPRNCGPRAALKGNARQAAASSKGEMEDRRGVNQRRGDGGERKGHRRKRERKQGSVGGGRDGQLRPAAPALGMCHSTRRRAAGAGGPRPLRPTDRPGGALRRRRPFHRSWKAHTSYTLTGAARQTPATPSGTGIAQRPQRVAMAPPHERRLVECGAELCSNPRKAEPRRPRLPRFGLSR